MTRETMIRLTDALEDAMCETGKGTTATDRAVWWACKPLWVLLQRILREWSETK